MPYRIKAKGKYQHPRRRGARGPRWGLMPLTALMIFAAVLVLTRTGLGDRLEAAVTAAAQSEAISSGVLRLVLPQGQSAGDAPPAAQVPVSDPVMDGVYGPQTDEPIGVGAVPPGPDEEHRSRLTDAELGLLLPDPGIMESVMPELGRGEAAAQAPVSSLTISGLESGYEGSGTVYLRNETDYIIDTSALLKKAFPVKLSGEGVQVLIMHTHGTEAYTPDAQHPYTATDSYRTTESSRNVLRVGDEIARILEENGIKTVHSDTLNDYPAYNGSYNRALEDISRYIKEHPSIKMVIDVHRDAMISASGMVYKTVAEIDGKQAAQLQFVTGTNQGGLKHDNWRENLTLQLKLQDRMNTVYPGIMRPVNIRTGRFNQHVTTGSMLLEVGTCGNSLSEALYSAQLFAQELAGMLNGK